MTTRSRLRGDFAVTKAIASIEPGPDDEEGPGSFSLILSTSDDDRDDESIAALAFDPLPDHISMDIDHGMSVATTVGSGRPFYRPDGKLQVDGTYASTPLGQTTRTLVREKHIRTASVAMLPLKKTKNEDGKTVIVKADLLNGAFTPVPSNKNAVILSSKSAAKVLDGVDTLLKAGARNSAGDQAVVQAIHDLVSNLGAICGNGSSEEGGSSGDPDNDGDANGVERGRKAVVDAHCLAVMEMYRTDMIDFAEMTSRIQKALDPTKTTEVAPQGDAESKTAADDAATKAASDAAVDLEAEVWELTALALKAARDS